MNEPDYLNLIIGRLESAMAGRALVLDSAPDENTIPTKGYCYLSIDPGQLTLGRYCASPDDDIFTFDVVSVGLTLGGALHVVSWVKSALVGVRLDSAQSTSKIRQIGAGPLIKDGEPDEIRYSLTTSFRFQT